MANGLQLLRRPVVQCLRIVSASSLESPYYKENSGGYGQVYIRVQAAGRADQRHHATGTKQFQF